VNGRVFHVVDPDHTVRQALGVMLRAMGADAACFDHAEALLDALTNGRAREPDAVISEIRLPGMQGLQLLDRVRGLAPGVQVILASAWADIPTANRALRAGALACIEKPWRELEMAELLSQAGAARDKEHARFQTARHAAISLAQLSEREQAVFRMICDGKLNKQIAAALGIAERTVEAHRSRVFAKFGVASIAELVRCAVALERDLPHCLARTEVQPQRQPTPLAA
jgi:two-component system response regulator FixJ